MTTLPCRKTALLLAALLCACNRPPEPPKPAEPEKPKAAEEKKTPTPVVAQKILSVEEVKVKPVDDEPGKLTISVIGSVNSSGWTHPELRPHASAEDGTLTFDFFALPPDAAQMRSPVLKKLFLTVTVDKPANYREVKVMARSNAMTAK